MNVEITVAVAQIVACKQQLSGEEPFFFACLAVKAHKFALAGSSECLDFSEFARTFFHAEEFQSGADGAGRD